MKNSYYIYIMGSNSLTLYIGVTNDLIRRINGHKNGQKESFTKKYNIKKLLYFEIYDSIEEAILREKRLKKWNRAWKLELIKNMNPLLVDLSEKVT